MNFNQSYDANDKKHKKVQPKDKTGKAGNLKNKKKAIIIALGIVIFSTFTLTINFFTDFLWFKEVDYLGVFFTKLVTQLKYGTPIFIVLLLLMWIYLRGLKKSYFKNIISNENTNVKRLNTYTWIISVAFGGIVSLHFARNLWFQLLEFLNSTPFGIKDPVFNLDISFYIFRLEFLDQLNEMLIGIIVLFFIATLIYYMILLTMHSPSGFEENEAEPIEDGKYSDESQANRNAYGRGQGVPFGENTPLGNIFNQLFGGRQTNYRNKTKVSNTNMQQLFAIASKQFTILGVIFFMMLAVNFVLMQFDLLHAHTGVVYGAGFTGVTVTLWVYRLLTLVSLVGAVAIGFLIKKKSFKKMTYIPASMIVIGLLGMGVAALVQNMVVAPDEINKESKYLKYNIEFTQAAYNISDVDTRSFEADNSLNAEGIATNVETVENIRINDYLPTNTFYNQTQSIRQYYKFNDVDVDRYFINGEYTQTYLAIREIDEDRISDTWINRHLKYTHGYGFALSRVNQITASGQPDVIVKNIPPESLAEEISITTPQIYFGELANDYVVINTGEDEFDYPNGQENAYSRYEGTAGISLNPINRLLFSLREGSLKLLVSSNINSDSRIIVNRNVRERVNKIMPYLIYENDPYGISVDGKIYWMIDAYTASSYYPYSEPYTGKVGTTNYIRNSIKVVVDAYNGDVSYYIVDENDPIAKTYEKIFPELFKSIEEMPENMRSHMRYPSALFEIQADVYARYHMDDVKVFYQNEDLWDVANEIYGTEERKMVPNYFVVKLPGESSPEFVSILPYTPKSKQNMTALILTRNDADHYGQLLLYTFPKNRTVYGPMQIEAQIDQNTEISRDFSLWSQAGSTYSRGGLFVVPIENSLLYVEPIYLEASNTAIPEVKRIVVAYGDRMAYKPTLAEALEVLFGEGTGVENPAGEVDTSGTESGGSETSVSEYIQQAGDLYDKAQEALKNGDWAAYGTYMSELEQVLDKLVELSEI